MKKFIALVVCSLLLDHIFIASLRSDAVTRAVSEKKLEKAIFAGGCYWGMQFVFDPIKGVIETVVGFTGGTKKNPTFEEVATGTTGHAEAIEILYDPSQISYPELLDLFWRNIVPTALNKQFRNVGTEYRTAIFYHSEAQKKLAQESKEKLEKSKRFEQPIVTEIIAASEFYRAGEQDQKYYKKHPLKFRIIRGYYQWGRDRYLEKIWGKG